MFIRYYQKIDDALAYLMASSLNEKKLLKSFFSKKKISLIDIGSNEGSYIDLINSIFFLNEIHCVEPLKKLTDKIKSRYNNANIYNIALSNRFSKRSFYEYSISSTSSLYRQNNLYKSFKNLKSKKIVITNTFDKVFGDKKKFDICKIDVQGEDFKVIMGMKNNLRKGNIKLLKVELSLEKFYENTNETFYDILFYLKKYNYKLISISKIKHLNNKITFMDGYFSMYK